MTDILRVLYVDDEADLLEIGKLFLEEMGGFSVDTCTSAQGGLASLASTAYDAIISDYQMPKMDGIAFLKEVRGRKNTIPFILFTGRGREEIVIMALNEGADFYLQKGGEPVAQFTELAHKIRLAVQQRRAEASIRDHERRETDIINFLPDATFAIDAGGIVIAWNRAMEDFSGMLASEILGKGDYEYSIPIYGERRPILIDFVLKDYPEIEGKYPYILRSGKKFFSEIYLPHKNNGEGAFIWFTASPLYDTQGKIVGAIESIRDITDRKRVEEETILKNLILSTQQETSPDAILIVDTCGKIVQYNRKFVEIWNIPPDLLAPGAMDEPVLQHVTGQVEGPETFLSRVRYLYDHQEEKTFDELRLNDGRILERYSAPMIDNGGKYHGRVWYFRDITIRKRAEEAVAREKTFIDAIFNSIPGMVYLYDSDGALIRWNRNHEMMTGYSPEELSRMHLFDWYKGDETSQAAVIEGLKRTRETGFGDAEALLQTKNGKILPMYFTATPLNIDGKQYFTGIGIDITGRRESEAALRDANALYARTQEIAHVGSWQWDPVTNRVEWSDETYRIFGFEPRSFDLTLENIRNRIHPGDREMHDRILARGIETSLYEPQVYRIIRPDGSVRTVHSVGEITKDSTGAVVQIRGSIQDITERKNTEEALLESERKYRTVIENIQDIFYRTDREGRLVMASPSWARILGYDSTDDCIGMDVAATFYYDPGERDRLLDEIRTHGFVENYEAILKKKNGEPVYVSTNSHQYYHPDGTIAGIEGIIRDITLLKQAELALRESEEKYRTVFETTGTAMILIEADETISLANSEFTRITGYSREEIENRMKWRTVVVPEDLERMLAQHSLRRRDRSAALTGYDFRLVTRTGSIRNVHLSIDLIPGTDRSVASLMDITDRTAAEDALRHKNDELHAAYEQITASEEELRANFDELAQQEKRLRDFNRRLADIIEFLPDATFAIDRSGTVIAWNHAIETMSGIPKDRMMGRNKNEYALWLYQERRSILIDYVLSGDPSVSSQYENLHRDGGTLFAEVFIPHLHDGRGGYLWFTASPLYDSDGQVTGAIESIREITELREREAALARKNEELGAAYEELTASDEELRQQVEEIASAQEALKASEERYRNIVEDQTEFISRFTPDGTHVFVNDAYCRYFGMAREDILAHRFQPRIHPDDRHRVEEFFRSLTPNNPVGTIEHRIIMPDGSTRWQWWSDRAIFENGRVTEYQSVGRDITEQKTTEAALQQAAGEYASLLENIQDVYFRTDSSGNLVRASSSFARFFGYDNISECLGRPVATAFYHNPEDRPTFIRDVLRTGSVSDYTLILKKKDGKPVSVSTNSHACYDQNGNLTGIEGTFRDMTERNRETECIREAEQRMTDIINFLPDPTFVIDRAGRVIAWNRAIEEMTGRTAETMLGRSDHEYALPFYGKRRPILIDMVFAKNTDIGKKYSPIRRDGEILTAESCTVTIGGRERILWGKAGPLYNSRGEATGAIESIRDISDRYLLEKSLQQLNRKMNLLGSITRHDINNQLTKQLGYIRMLEKNLPEPKNEYLQKIATTAQLISAMIRFTKQYEDIGAKAAVWQEIHPVCDEVARELVPPEISVINDIPRGIAIYADPLIQKVFYNLTDNAVRYGRTLKTIRFSTRMDGDTLVISCEDDGAGIPDDEKERIFDRGYGSNTGLGLALSREILDITGITIAETGTPGNGARFDITVPKGGWRSAGQSE